MNTLKARCLFVTSLLAVICVWADSSVQAQTSPATTLSTSSDYVCVQRGPDSKLWQRAVLQTNQAGVVRTNLQTYNELATGLCHLKDGQYVDSGEEVAVVAGGAQAIQGRHQVWWAGNAKTPNGAVILTTPDGKTLTSTVFGLAYYDIASGSNAAIARLQDCNGSIVAPNQVVYTGAFSNLAADVQYTYRKAGLSQDIVLRQAPPAPDRYGLADETTVLQVYTEFFNPPQPEMTAVTNGNVADDQILNFGDMKMGIGQALFLNGQEAPMSAGMVTKQWIKVDGSTFLIESVPYQSISNLLQALPQSMNLTPRRGSIRRVVLMESSPSGPRQSVKGAGLMQMARVETVEPRLVVDYNLSNSTNNLTLQGDTTYLVTGTVNVSGTVTIEGGTVVKYTNNYGENSIVASNFVCQTGPYRPGVFTSMNDDSVGSKISGSTGKPANNVPNMYLEFDPLQISLNSLIFKNLRFSYADYAIFGAITTNNCNSIEIMDCQFINCGEAFFSPAVEFRGSNPGFPINVYNVLFSRCRDGFVTDNDGTSYVDINLSNVTADQVGTFVSGTSNVCYATNCIFTAVTNLQGYSTSCYTNASSNGVYQTVGAGSYYLADGSANRGMGTININTNLLADLQTKTTYPPVTNFCGLLTNDYTFFPQAQRDTNGATVDTGYHYDPIDYALCMQMSNSTVTVLSGTVLAGCGPEYGVWLFNNAVFNCAGDATTLNYIVRYNTVQEQSNTNWSSTNWAGSLQNTSGGGFSPSTASFRFAEWSVLGSDRHLYSVSSGGSLLTFQDCQLYNGEFTGISSTETATNCLFQRVNTFLDDLNATSAVPNSFHNNLFWEGELLYGHNSGGGSSGLWTFRDNLFDQTSFTNISGSTIDICLSNAYVTTSFGVLSSSSPAVILSSSPPYETGTLGDYYYPTNLTNLITNGSQTAATAGLYHYTITTNNVIEGTNQVSIGFHYIACSNGLPLISNPNGMPDYMEDTNGDGIVDDGETVLQITSQPLTQTVNDGSSATFTVVAEGLGLLTYQWRFSGTNNISVSTNMPGATNSSYTISDVQAANAGNYFVVVANLYGCLRSGFFEVHNG
ncbi:MAG: immunoglobulin domain-containing protein [Verrucomicrobiota bacterium]|jgi:hypothetical protein